MLFEAGADMVGIAEPTIEDPRYISKILDESGWSAIHKPRWRENE
jgi:hypothetical protein